MTPEPEPEPEVAADADADADAVAQADAAPERTDDLPAPADAEPTEAVEATDAYAEAPTPEVADAAVEEAVGSAPADDLAAEG